MNARNDETLWLAGNEPERADFLEREPLLQYWYLLDRQVKDTNRKRANAQRSNGRTGSNRAGPRRK
jgi:hypothetical protein